MEEKMDTLLDILKTLGETPLPVILIIVGSISLLLAMGVKLGPIVMGDGGKRKYAGIVGIFFCFIGLGIYIFPMMLSSGIVKPKPQEPSWPRTPNGKYEAVQVQKNGTHYQVKEVGTGKLGLITSGQFVTANDVKAGLFSPDSKKIAAAYHYGHEGNYTWVGIWDIETHNLVGTKRISGWTTDIYSVFREE